jgi:hypothetical protein
VRSTGGNNADGPHGRRRSVEDPRLWLSARLDAGARRNLGAAGLAWFLVLAGGVTAYWAFRPIFSDPLDNDLTLVYIAVRIGFEQGWSHIYSIDLQHQVFAQVRSGVPFGSGERFLSPPPLAWLIAPLSLLGAAGAFYAWLGISLGAVVAAWWMAAPGNGLLRALWLLGALAWYPVLYSLSLGQPAMIVVFAVAACWRLAEAGKPYAAGAVLGLSVVKPQLMLMVPLVLLVAGHWRIAAAWAVTAAVLAALSLLLIGNQGLGDYRSLLAEAQTLPNNRFFTLAYDLGPGALSYVAAAVVAVISLVGAYLNRGAGLSRLFALGLVASSLSATYWHLQDFTILVLAAWLFCRETASTWQRLWLLAVVVAGELAWPLGPQPILFAVAVWLAFMVVPSQSRAASTLAAA